MKDKKDEKPSPDFDFLVKSGMDEKVALEIDQNNQRKNRKRKRMKREEEEKWK